MAKSGLTSQNMAVPMPERITEKAEQILEGAMQEFLAHGYAATSMDRVATAAGVSKATVYSHFHDKEGLFAALVKRLAQQKFALIYGAQSLETDPKVALRQMALTALDQILSDRQHLAFIRLIIGESERFPKLAQIFVQNLTKPSLEYLSHYLAAHPQLHLPDPEATARIVMGTLVHFVQVQEMLHGKDLLPMEGERLVDNLADLILSCSQQHQSDSAD